MPTRKAEAEWQGNLIDGKGIMKLGSGAFEGAYDWRSRSGDGAGTNPEELLGAAHAGCFSMALSAQLANNNTPATRIHTKAAVHFEKAEGGFVIPRIDLVTEAEIPGIEDAKFQELAATAKAGCPVSKALAGVEIHLTATLLKSETAA